MKKYKYIEKKQNKILNVNFLTEEPIYRRKLTK